MTLRPTDLISLDTNVLVHWIRQNKTGIQLRDMYRLHERTDRPIYSTVVEGELRALARCWNWGSNKLDLLDQIFAKLVRVPRHTSGSPSRLAFLHSSAPATLL